MCNPRRVEITATREICEAWEREARRTVRLSEDVVGEARIVQPLGESLGEPVLRALEMTLAEGDADWAGADDGYRHEVDGGFVVYRPDSGELEIVATRRGRITAEGSASEMLRGEVRANIEAQGVGHWDDEELDGATLSRAQRSAEFAAERGLREETARRLDQAGDAAEAQRADALERRADEDARKRLGALREGARDRLDASAQKHLETVGLRCRQAFYRLLGRAYRDALLAYARREGAEIVQNEENGDVIEIELNLQL